MRRDDAETVALKALAWLAADEEMLKHFCAATGSAPAELRSSAADAEFLAAILDFLALDDLWVLGFAAEAGLPPETLAAARAALPGGDLPHWT